HGPRPGSHRPRLHAPGSPAAQARRGGGSRIAAEQPLLGSTLRQERSLRTSDFHFDLPKDRIAQHPAPERDASRLMTLDRATGAVTHHRFPELPARLRPGDLVLPHDTLALPPQVCATASGTV